MLFFPVTPYTFRLHLVFITAPTSPRDFLSVVAIVVALFFKVNNSMYLISPDSFQKNLKNF